MIPKVAFSGTGRSACHQNALGSLKVDALNLRRQALSRLLAHIHRPCFGDDAGTCCMATADACSETSTCSFKATMETPIPSKKLSRMTGPRAICPRPAAGLLALSCLAACAGCCFGRGMVLVAMTAAVAFGGGSSGPGFGARSGHGACPGPSSKPLSRSTACTD